MPCGQVKNNLLQDTSTQTNRADASSPEMPPRKRVTRPALEIPLEPVRPPIIIKADDNDRFPGTVLRSMWRLTRVVFLQTSLEIGRDAYVSLVGVGGALEEVNILHLQPLAPK